MTVLTDRVSLLEEMLKDRGAEPPPVVYPPKTTRGSLNMDGDHSPARGPQPPSQQLPHPPPPPPPPPPSQPPPQQPPQQPQFAITHHALVSEHSPESLPEDANDYSQRGSVPSVDGQRDRSDQDMNQGTPIDDKNQGLVSRLLSTRGHLSFDQISGRLRYYGPTVNSHIYSELEVDDAKSNRENLEQARRAEKIIRTLPLETHDYLMKLFFEHYNGVLHVVHEAAFHEDRENGRTQFYSGFLHICILAMGYRFVTSSFVTVSTGLTPNQIR